MDRITTAPIRCAIAIAIAIAIDRHF